VAERRFRPSRALPDEWYLRLVYWRNYRRLLNLKNPRAYTAKLQWLKLYGELERYDPYVDKYEVRQHVAETVGEQYLIPLIGVWDSFDEIPFDQFPQQFVLKATHGWSYNYICRDKSTLDLRRLRQTTTQWMTTNFYSANREPQYRNVRPRLMAETYLEDDSGALRDFKFLCFGGEPRILEIMTDRESGLRINFYDRQWNLLPVEDVDHPNTPEPIARPAALDEMFGVAAKLASGFEHVRVDLYNVGGSIYFSELTFTPGNGFISFNPKSFDEELGCMLDLTRYTAPSLRN